MKRREFLTPDLTPLIDIIFLLLIFFLVSTVFKDEKLALNLNLPLASNSKEITSKKDIYIELDANKLAINEKIVDFEAFENSLKELKNRKELILIYIDEEVKYQRIVTIFDTLQKYNLTNIALVNREEKK